MTIFIPAVFFSQQTENIEPVTNIEAVEEEVDINEILGQKEFQKGFARFQNRQYQAAIQFFLKALSYIPKDYRSRYYLAEAYLKSGYTRNAIQEWEHMINLGQGDFRIKQKLNDLYFRLSIDKGYEISSSYVFTGLYDGIIQGKHKVIRPSFIYYDDETDHLLISAADTQYVVEIDGSMELVRQIGRQFGDFSRFSMPTGIALYQNQFYIADYEKDEVMVFSREGEYLKTLISSEAEQGELNFFRGILRTVMSFFRDNARKDYSIENLAGPMGLTVSDDAYLYVVDNGKDRIQKYDLNGRWIQQFGNHILKRPTDIIEKDGLIYVTDSGNSRVVCFDRSGNLIRIIGENIFSEPRGLDIADDRLIIVDASDGIYEYLIDEQKIESIDTEQKKLQYPFDAVVDVNGIIYETDFNSQYIANYTPLELQYGNLNVDISRIWLSQYPTVFVHFRVWDKSGRPIDNLGNANVDIYEKGTLIPLSQIGTTMLHKDKMDITFIVEKTADMEPYYPEAETLIRNFIEKMEGNDWLDLYRLGDEMEWSGKIKANVLWTLDFFSQEGFSEEPLKELDKTIYNAVSRQLNINRKKAVVLICSGKSGNEAFQDYDQEIISTYARQNGIPVYVISMTSDNENLFRNLAEQTYGSYFLLNESRGELNDLFSIVSNAQPLEYIVSYDGLNLSGLTDHWVDVRLSVDYKGMEGMDLKGYYVPESVSSGLFEGLQKNEIKIEAEKR